MKDYENLSERGREWQDFSNVVLEHIEKYTVPQYGDKPNDQAEQWLPVDCAKAINRYALRHGKNSRENQDALDFKKIAHYACLGYYKTALADKDQQDCIKITEYYKKDGEFVIITSQIILPVSNTPVNIGQIQKDSKTIGYIVCNTFDQTVHYEPLIVSYTTPEFMQCITDVLNHVTRCLYETPIKEAA